MTPIASSPARLTLSWLDSPIGPLALACDGEGLLRGLSFGGPVEGGLIKAMRREYPDAATLERLGVRRLSAGSGIVGAALGRAAALTRGFLADGRSAPLMPQTR